VKPSSRRIRRREFLQKSAAGAVSAGFVFVPRYVLGRGQVPPSERLNMAGIGVGGHGAFLLNGMARQCGDLARIVALCDVDEKRASERIVRKIPAVVNVGGFKRFPEARRYHDFRRMLDKEEKNIDGVVVATPDHTHAVASVAAMQRGKHVYCEKPLAHDVYQVRRMTELARQKGVATQMGIGNHSTETFRRVVELVRAGAIGEVKEVHAWCDNDPGMGKDDGVLPWGDRRPAQRPPVPDSLHWDLWLGPAPYRPYHPAYLPVVWRNWWDFGNGRLGDMGCHLLDLVFWTLDLKYPETVEAEGPKPPTREVAPHWMSVMWTFGPRDNRPPVTLTWHHGVGRRPPIAKEVRLPDWPVAVLFVGSKGLLVDRSRPTSLQVVARGSLRRFPVASTFDPALARPLPRMAAGLQRRATGSLPLRLFGTFDRDGPAGLCGLPHGRETPVGCAEPESHQLRRGGAVYPAQLP